MLNSALAEIGAAPATTDATLQRALIIGYRGKLKRNPGDAKEARRLMEQVVAAAPGNALAWAALGGCAAERKLAATLGRVILELVRDLATVPLDDQRLHPACRQTLRLAGELQALHTLLVAAPCPDPFGCVRARQPEQWGRRTEDVEIAEVRAVLFELAAEIAG